MLSRKLPSFSFSSASSHSHHHSRQSEGETEDEGETDSRPGSSSGSRSRTKSRGLFGLTAGFGRKSRSPSPYAGRSKHRDGAASTSARSRSPSTEREREPTGPELPAESEGELDYDHRRQQQGIKRSSSAGSTAASQPLAVSASMSPSSSFEGDPLQPVRSISSTSASSAAAVRYPASRYPANSFYDSPDEGDASASEVEVTLVEHVDHPRSSTSRDRAAAGSGQSDTISRQDEQGQTDETDESHQGEAEAEDTDDDSEMDPELKHNTDANRGTVSAVDYLIANFPATADAEILQDGPNMVKGAPSPFPESASSLSSRIPSGDVSNRAEAESSGASRPPRQRRRSTIRQDYPLVASRPIYERNRCTITITHGDPDGFLAGTLPSQQQQQPSGRPYKRRRKKTYVVASDLSEESYYAIEWAIGTVLRNGDELLYVTVMETDSKLDPENLKSYDKTAKIRNQQERQTRVLQLSREATALLERTRLHVRVMCQAIHAKNARHMLVDLIDYVQPTLVIIGSRGLSKLKGIILGSVSHYLIQKSSSPVMVTRRRLKPLQRPRRPISDLQREPRVDSLAEAAIDKESHAGMVENDDEDEEHGRSVEKDGDDAKREAEGGDDHDDGDAEREGEQDEDEDQEEQEKLADPVAASSVQQAGEGEPRAATTGPASKVQTG